MKKKKNKLDEPRSKCCFAPIKLSGIGEQHETITCFYMCTKCKKICDVLVIPRRTWHRNPKTQVQKDKREKIRKKETDKEIKEVGNA